MTINNKVKCIEAVNFRGFFLPLPHYLVQWVCVIIQVMSEQMALTFQVSPDVLEQELDGETVLLDLGSDNYFGLDEVGTRVWQLLRDGKDSEAIVDRMADEFDVEIGQLRTDLEALLAELSGAGLIKQV